MSGKDLINMSHNYYAQASSSCNADQDWTNRYYLPFQSAFIFFIWSGTISATVFYHLELAKMNNPYPSWAKCFIWSLVYFWLPISITLAKSFVGKMYLFVANCNGLNHSQTRLLPNCLFPWYPDSFWNAEVLIEKHIQKLLGTYVPIFKIKQICREKMSWHLESISPIRWKSWFQSFIRELLYDQLICSFVTEVATLTASSSFLQ